MNFFGFGRKKEQNVYDAGNASISFSNRLRMSQSEELELANSLAVSLVTDELKENMMRDGFVIIPKIVDEKYCDIALSHINRSLGDNSLPKNRENPVPQMHLDTVPARQLRASIAALYNKSALSIIVDMLLGPTREAGRVHAGQVALRFPGDACDEAMVPNRHFQKGWHIDGLREPGKINNFSCLVGVLLSDVPEPLSGELVVFPGSHESISTHFVSGGGFEALRLRGDQMFNALELRESLTPKKPVGFCGRKGDIVIANYLTAHTVRFCFVFHPPMPPPPLTLCLSACVSISSFFSSLLSRLPSPQIAPNRSSSIRYACYFRIHSSAFEGNYTRYESIVDPWIDWQGLLEYRRENDEMTRAIERSLEEARAANGGSSSNSSSSNSSSSNGSSSSNVPVPTVFDPPAATEGGTLGSEEQQLRLAMQLSLADADRNPGGPLHGVHAAAESKSAEPAGSETEYEDLRRVLELSKLET
jgi:hypothetical protein